MQEGVAEEAVDPFAGGGAGSRTLAGNMVVVTLGKAIAVVVGLASMAILARHLGPESFGHYRTALTYMSIAAVPADLGLYMVTLREITRPDANQSKILSAALTLRLLTSIAILSGGAIIAMLIPYEHDVHIGIWLSMLVYIGYQGTEFLAAVFQARLAQTPRMIGETVGGLAMLAAVAAVAWFGGGALWMIVATAAGALLSFAWCWWQAEKLIRFGFSIDWKIWHQLVIMGLPVAGSQMLIIALVRGDTFVLSLFHSATDVGLYGIPTKIFEILTTLSFIFGGSMMGFFVRAVSDGDQALFEKRFNDAIETMMVFGLGVAIFMLFHAADVLRLVGGDAYVAGAPALQLLGIAIAAQNMVHMFRYGMTSREKQQLVLRVDMIAVVMGFSLYLILIPPYSFVGAASATAINEVLTLACLFYFARGEVSYLGLSRILRVLLSASVLAAILWGCRAMDIYWLLAVPISGVFYIGALIVFGVLKREILTGLVGDYLKN